eukprot:SAG11_NODE_30123_length_304_cov_0.604878_1_plen_29_part_10
MRAYGEQPVRGLIGGKQLFAVLYHIELRA